MSDDISPPIVAYCAAAYCTVTGTAGLLWPATETTIGILSPTVAPEGTVVVISVDETTVNVADLPWNVTLVEPVGELLQHPLARFGGVLSSLLVRQTDGREASFHIAHSHDPSDLLIALRLPIVSRYDRIGRMFACAG